MKEKNMFSNFGFFTPYGLFILIGLISILFAMGICQVKNETPVSVCQYKENMALCTEKGMDDAVFCELYKYSDYCGKLKLEVNHE